MDIPIPPDMLVVRAAWTRWTTLGVLVWVVVAAGAVALALYGLAAGAWRAGAALCVLATIGIHLHWQYTLRVSLRPVVLELSGEGVRAFDLALLETGHRFSFTLLWPDVTEVVATRERPLPWTGRLPFRRRNVLLFFTGKYALESCFDDGWSIPFDTVLAWIRDRGVTVRDRR